MSNIISVLGGWVDRLVQSTPVFSSADLLIWSNFALSATTVLVTGGGVWVARRALFVSSKSVKVSSQAIEEQVRSERQSRSLQTLLHCQSVYKTIESERLQFRYSDYNLDLKTDRGKIISLFRNYWTHKSDQMDYWLSGYVDYDTFLTWNISTLRHFVKNRDEPFFYLTFMVGWAHFGRPYHKDINPLFVRFTDAMQVKFKDNVTVDHEDMIKLIAMIREIDKKNIEIEKGGRITRRYGSPENLDRFEKDLIELQSNMKDFLSSYLKDYDFQNYGEDLKAANKLPLAFTGGATDAPPAASTTQGQHEPDQPLSLTRDRGHGVPPPP